MKQIISLVFFFSLVSGIYSQTLFTRTDTLTITGDTVTLQAGKFRGTIQWQHSPDGQTWENLAGKTDTLLLVSAKNEGFYRAEVTDETCNPVYSDTAQIKSGFKITKFINTEVGDAINTPDGSLLIIPAGALPESGNVTIASVAEDKQPDIPNKNLMIFGKPYNIYIPCDSLKKNITFSFKLDSLPNQLESFVPCLYNGKSFYPIEYTIDGNTVTATIDKCSWENYSSTKSANVLGEAITIVCVIAIQAPPARQMGIKEINLSNGEMFFAEPSAITDTSKILLLIHGWTDKPETWTNFIQKIKLESDIKFDKIWTFGYNSSLGIDENGARLSGGLAIYTHGAKVKIVAHSMGGLVARSMIENYGGSIYVRKLITLGTPHLGSPLGAIRDMLGNVMAIEQPPIPLEFYLPGTSFVYDYKTQGFRDLDENSGFIADMKTTLKSPVPYCCIAGVNLPTDNVVIKEQDDFAVGLLSALGAPTPVYRGYHAITCSFPDFAHNKLLTNAEVFFKTKELLKDDFTLKVVQGDKQTGVAGKPLALPIIVQVLDEIEKPVKGAKVYFESEFSPGKYLTIDSRDDGKVAVEWTLANVEGTQKVNVFLADDNGKKIEKSALVITAECKIDAPTITTNTVSNITETSATCGGNITDDGGAEITARGVCWNTTGTPNIANSKTSNGAGTGAFTSGLSDLAEGTTYYVRAYATNSKGTAYGNEVSFTTPSAITITTAGVSNITSKSATCGGTISSNKTITARGVCWNTTGNPTISDSKTSDGSGTGSFTSFLTGLTANTTYYMRAYSTTNEGIEYGNLVSFKSDTVQDCNCDKKYDLFTDSRDGHVYKTIQIGSQTWMAENLAYLPYTTSTSKYSSTEPCYYVFNYTAYAVLYNWPAALTACPPGWHLPSAYEWFTLIGGSHFNNGYGRSGTITKALASTTGWNSSSVVGTPGNDPSSNNSSCFSALPGGYYYGTGFYFAGRYYYGFYEATKNGYWWHSSATGESYAGGFNLAYLSTNVSGFGDYNTKYNGYSVRCVKD